MPDTDRDTEGTVVDKPDLPLTTGSRTGAKTGTRQVRSMCHKETPVSCGQAGQTGGFWMTSMGR